MSLTKKRDKHILLHLIAYKNNKKLYFRSLLSPEISDPIFEMLIPWMWLEPFQVLSINMYYLEPQFP